MQQITAKQFQDQKLIDQGITQGITQSRAQGRIQGRAQGRAQGAFEIALNVKNTFRIEHALKICDFTREELETEKLNL